MRPHRKPLQWALFLVALIGTLEVVARSLSHVLPIEIQQKYSNLAKKSKSQYFVNGSGARGNWYHDGKTRVALFGSSIAAMRELSEAETWTRLLETHSPVPLHIDNFAAGFTRPKMLTEIFENFAKENVRYDAIIIQLRPATGEVRREHYYSMTYYSRWIIPQNTWCALCYLSQQFLVRRVPYEAQFWTGWEALREGPRRHTKRIDFNRERHQEARRKGLFSDTPTPRVPSVEKRVAENLERMFRAAKKVTPNVVWMPENIGFHPNMRPEYLDRYITLWPTRRKTGHEEYLSPTAHKNLFDTMNNIALSVAQQHDVTIMDWTLALSQEMVHRSDLYLDEYHLSKEGSQRVFEILKSPFYDYIVGKVRIENK